MVDFWRPSKSCQGNWAARQRCMEEAKITLKKYEKITEVNEWKLLGKASADNRENVQIIKTIPLDSF